MMLEEFMFTPLRLESKMCGMVVLKDGNCEKHKRILY